jgi:hypothetical protein
MLRLACKLIPWTPSTTCAKLEILDAHMEADINVIVDVDPNEAQKLIELAELLFDEWYIGREKRTQCLKELGELLRKRRGSNSKNSLHHLRGPKHARRKSLVRCRAFEV